MAIPECKLNEAIEDGDLDMFECPFPVKYVLQKDIGFMKNTSYAKQNIILHLD